MAAAYEAFLKKIQQGLEQKADPALAPATPPRAAPGEGGNYGGLYSGGFADLYGGGSGSHGSGTGGYGKEATAGVYGGTEGLYTGGTADAETKSEADGAGLKNAADKGGSQKQPTTAQPQGAPAPQQQAPAPDVTFSGVYEGACQAIRNTGTLETLMVEFLALKTDLERVKYVAEMAEVQRLRNLQEHYDNKDEETAANYEKVYDLLIPNEASAAKALDVIKKCVLKTPPEDNTALAVRYMKRGWASLLLEYFDDAEVDAKMSLSFKCPEELMWNAHEILGYCCARLQNNKAAEGHFHKALENLRKSPAPNEVKATVTGRIMAVFKTVKAKKNKKGGKNSGSAGRKEANKPAVPQLTYGQHKTFACASSALEFVHVPGKGRTTIAKRNIKPGDVLMVDAPYCTMFNAEHFSTHCYHCFTRCFTPVPCPSCAKVVFCGWACQRAAWAGLHQAECRVLSHLIDPALGKIGLLSYRVLTTLTWAGAQKWKDQIEQLVEEEANSAVTEAGTGSGQGGEPQPLMWEGKYQPHDYRTVLHLAANSSKRAFGDMFKRAISAVFLSHCLRLTNYFGNGDVTEDDLLFIASVLLRHLQSGSCNAYEVSEVEVGEAGPAQARLLELGGALYPTVSLTNHACAANATRYSVGDRCVLRAVQTIPCGAEVLDNYGFFFYSNTVNERQEALQKQYKFECSCVACINMWPLYPHHPSETLVFKCPSSGCNRSCCYSTSSRKRCNACGNTQQYTRLLQEIEHQLLQYKEGLARVRAGDVATAVTLFVAHLAFLDQHVLPPVKHYTDAQEAVKQSYSFLGNVYVPRRTAALATATTRTSQKLRGTKREVVVPR